MVRILCRVICKAHNKTLVCRVLTQNIGHLILAPRRIICTGVFGGSQCTLLHCGVVAAGAPFILEVVGVVGGVNLTGDVGIDGGPVTGDVGLDDMCTQGNIVPAVYPTDICGQCLVHQVQIGIVLGGQVKPSCCPCHIVLVVIGAIEAGRTVRCNRVDTGCITQQRLCVFQILFIAEVDIVERQCGSIFSGNIACSRVRPVFLLGTLLLLLSLRCVPVAVIHIAVSQLIAEAGYRITVELCTVFKESSKIVCDGSVVIRQTQAVIGLLEFVVAPAKSGSSVALGQTENGVVARIVEASVNAVAGVAVAAPGHP